MLYITGSCYLQPVILNMYERVPVEPGAVYVFNERGESVLPLFQLRVFRILHFEQHKPAPLLQHPCKLGDCLRASVAAARCKEIK